MIWKDIHHLYVHELQIWVMMMLFLPSDKSTECADDVYNKDVVYFVFCLLTTYIDQGKGWAYEVYHHNFT